jgi:hypothetical protein
MTNTRSLSEVWPIELMAFQKDWVGHPTGAIADEFLIGELQVIVHDPAANFSGVTLSPLLETSSLNDHTLYYCPLCCLWRNMMQRSEVYLFEISDAVDPLRPFRFDRLL